MDFPHLYDQPVRKLGVTGWKEEKKRRRGRAYVLRYEYEDEPADRGGGE